VRVHLFPYKKSSKILVEAEDIAEDEGHRIGRPDETIISDPEY
jgi:hypothetical protein